MDEMFEEVLAICLDRLSDGDDVESCVADFPECPDLQPLLEIAAALTRSRRTTTGASTARRPGCCRGATRIGSDQPVN